MTSSYLHYFYSLLEIEKVLIHKKNEISKEKDGKGKTPLHHAVTWGDLEMV